MTRYDFLKNTLAALGFAALPGGRLFLAPLGWKHEGKPNLVFGVVSDTHLRTTHKSNRPGKYWPDKYFRAALEYFRERNVDAVMNCGDMAHRGQTVELKFHADVWFSVFPKNLAPDGHEVVKLFVTGNHDAIGADYGDFVKKRYPDPVERAKHLLATDMSANWKKIWGEEYSPVWHKTVKGYHFFGRNWDVPHTELADLINTRAKELGLDASSRPFFMMQHRRLLGGLRKAVRYRRNAVAFFGHNHWSLSNWNVPACYQDSFLALQCASCEPRGCHALAHDAYISKVPIEGKEGAGRGRQGFVVSVYDDMIVFERHEFGSGGKLGADWVLPIGDQKPHPFSRGELKKIIGEPRFRAGACPVVKQSEDGSAVTVEIPPADAEPKTRAYAYEVVVTDGKGAEILRKAVYAAGLNLGMGRAPNKGVTALSIPSAEFSGTDTLKFTVRPLTSLGTSGRAIAANAKFKGKI